MFSSQRENLNRKREKIKRFRWVWREMDFDHEDKERSSFACYCVIIILRKDANSSYPLSEEFDYVLHQVKFYERKSVLKRKKIFRSPSNDFNCDCSIFNVKRFSKHYNKCTKWDIQRERVEQMKTFPSMAIYQIHYLDLLFVEEMKEAKMINIMQKFLFLRSKAWKTLHESERGCMREFWLA